MKKTRKYLLAALAVLVLTMMTALTAFARDPVPTGISRAGAATRSVTVGSRFELKVRTTPRDAEDDYLVWSIVGNSGVVRFEDYDRTGDEAELVAVKAGTARVRCSIRGKSSKYSKTFTVKVTKAAKSTGTGLTRVGKKTKTVEAGEDLDLKVKVNGSLGRRYLKWTIKDTSILGYDDDRYGRELEVKGRRTGKTTVTCKNLKTGKTVTYTVWVIPEHPDDFDYDDD